MPPPPVIRSENANLLTTILWDTITRCVEVPAVSNKAEKLRASFLITAGKMKALVTFGDSGIVIERARGDESVNAHVSGQLSDFVDVLLGKSVFARVLTRKVRFGGNPFLLMKFLSLLKE